MNPDIGNSERVGMLLLAVWVAFFVLWPAVRVFAAWLVERLHGPELAPFSPTQDIVP